MIILTAAALTPRNTALASFQSVRRQTISALDPLLRDLARQNRIDLAQVLFGKP